MMMKRFKMMVIFILFRLIYQLAFIYQFIRLFKTSLKYSF